MSDLYRENILEHYRNPRNYGSLDTPDASITDTNPLCGDCLTLEINCDNQDILTDMAFTAKGCALSVASASLLSEDVVGKNIKDIEKIDYNDMQDLLEIKVGAGRAKCILLPLSALHKAIKKIEKKDHD
jgi:nitrogen fixation protein NifU and related proteins